MDISNVTLGQITRAIAIITRLWVFREKIIKGFNKTFDDKLKPIKDDLKIQSDMIYQLLDHASTNNNTGGMKARLDKYIEYKIKS